MVSPRKSHADADLGHLSPPQRAIAYMLGVLIVAPAYFVLVSGRYVLRRSANHSFICQRPLYLVVIAIAKALAPSVRKKEPPKQPPKEDNRRIRKPKENPKADVKMTTAEGPFFLPRGVPTLYAPKGYPPETTASAPPILPCGEAAVSDAEKSMWYAQLANSLAWVASPISDYVPLMPGGERGTEAGSSRPPPAWTCSTGNDSEGAGGSIDSSSTKVEGEATPAASKASTSPVNVLDHAGTVCRRPVGMVDTAPLPPARISKSISAAGRLAAKIPAHMRDATGRPLDALPGVVFTQRYVNPLSAAFGLGASLRRENGGRSSEATSLSEDSSGMTFTGDNCSGGRTSTSSLGSPWQDPFTMDTPRAGAQLSRGKFGSIRKLGTRLRKSVSLRRSRSASLDIGTRRNASLQPSPLRQQVLTSERPASSRASSGSLSTSVSLPYGLGVDVNQSALGWEYGLP